MRPHLLGQLRAPTAASVYATLIYARRRDPGMHLLSNNEVLETLATELPETASLIELMTQLVTEAWAAPL